VLIKYNIMYEVNNNDQTSYVSNYFCYLNDITARVLERFLRFYVVLLLFMFYYFIVFLSSGWPVSDRKPLLSLYMYLYLME